jgi:chromosome segregation ATPase
VVRLKEAINQAENKVRSKDEAIRNTEKRIQACREDISRIAEQVNSHLVTIGLQKVQNSTDMNSS